MSAAEFDEEIVGRVVLDAGGGRIGQVSTLYRDLDTGVVSFAGVAVIRHGRRRIVFVPLHGATLQRASITVSCGKLPVRRAPWVRPGESLPAGAEADLFLHYELPYLPREPRDGRRLIPYI